MEHGSDGNNIFDQKREIYISIEYRFVYVCTYVGSN